MTRSSPRSVYRDLYELLSRQERRKAVVLLGLMIVAMVLETLGVGLVIPAILVITQEDLGTAYPVLQPFLDALGNPSHSELIVFGMISLLGVYLTKALYLAFLAWVQLRFIFGVRVRMSQQLFRTYLNQPHAFHLKRNSAQLMRNALSGVTQVTQNALNPALYLVTEVLLLIGIGTLLLVIEPLGALIVAVVLGGAAGTFYLFTRRQVTNWGATRQHHEGLKVQHLQQGLGGVKEVKLLGREAEFLRQFSVHNVETARISRLESTLHQLPRLGLELLAVTGLVVLVITMLTQGRDMATILPILGLFGAAAFRLMPSVNKILNSTQSMRFSQAVVTHIRDEMRIEEAPDIRTQSVGQIVFDSELRLSDVTFAYPATSKPALQHISLQIRKGEHVGFIGPSGAGKSTLVDIILGLLEPDSGSITVDDRDIHEALRSWQNQLGYVPQSIYLTDDSLRRNIAFGLPVHEIDDAAVERAARAAQLDTLIETLPLGMETLVGERGVRLSGGQRQRIGIARALYHDPPVLVLDEATSALDTSTEQEVMNAVTALHGIKTVLIVAHRLSTVARCDRLYRMEGGEIIEQGTPESVLPVRPALVTVPHG